jgi:ribonucleoside-diphosphate reductase subunit M2
MTQSPAKKIDFTVADKENSNVAVKVAGIPELDFTQSTGDKGDVNVASTIKDEEKHELLLRENPQRFVLFPIQHHEVRMPVHASSTRCLHLTS